MTLKLTTNYWLIVLSLFPIVGGLYFLNLAIVYYPTSTDGLDQFFGTALILVIAGAVFLGFVTLSRAIKALRSNSVKLNTPLVVAFQILLASFLKLFGTDFLFSGLTTNEIVVISLLIAANLFNLILIILAIVAKRADTQPQS